MNIDYTGTTPERAHGSDAGYDLRARIDGTGPTFIPSKGRAVIPVGVSVAVPHGYCGQVVPRSGLAAKNGITVLNTPGIIDPGYRGEIKVVLYNTDDQPFPVRNGDRIAQLLIVKVEHPDFVEVEDLGFSDRGVKGFGSSGVK